MANRRTTTSRKLLAADRASEQEEVSPYGLALRGGAQSQEGQGALGAGEPKPDAATDVVAGDGDYEVREGDGSKPGKYRVLGRYENVSLGKDALDNQGGTSLWRRSDNKQLAYFQTRPKRYREAPEEGPTREEWLDDLAEFDDG